VNNDRNAPEPRRQHNRDRNKAAFREHNGGVQRAKQVNGLKHTGDHAKQIHNVFKVEIAAELSTCDTVKRNPRILNDLPLHPVPGSDPDGPALKRFRKRVPDSDSRIYMTTGTAAGKNYVPHVVSLSPA
jgi:hypothetical protein